MSGEIAKTRGWGGSEQKSVSWARQDGLKAALVAYISSTPDQVSQHSGRRGGGTGKSSPLSEEPLTVDGFLGKAFCLKAWVKT